MRSLAVYFVKRENRDNKPQSREEPGRETTEKPPDGRHQGNTESRKTLEQKLIFQIGTLNPDGINERFSFN